MACHEFGDQKSDQTIHSGHIRRVGCRVNLTRLIQKRTVQLRMISQVREPVRLQNSFLMGKVVCGMG